MSYDDIIKFKIFVRLFKTSYAFYLFNNTFIIKSKINNNFIKTLPKFDSKEKILLLQENTKNKNKFKELRFKIHNTIKQNIPAKLKPNCSTLKMSKQKPTQPQHMLVNKT